MRSRLRITTALRIRSKVDDEGWGRGRQPIMNVSWNDAREYVAWLSSQTGHTYRLLTEAEWEYAARAGSATQFSWGNEIGQERANCGGCSTQWDFVQTAPVGSFAANAFGLHEMHGNVWEWVEDCWNGSYSGAPANGDAWLSGDCSQRILRGGSYDDFPYDLRSAIRVGNAAGYPQQQPRFPRCPDTHPLNLYILASNGGPTGAFAPVDSYSSAASRFSLWRLE